MDHQSVMYVHTISGAGRLLPSASEWNSIEIDFNLVPKTKNGYESLPSKYSKSYDYDLVITDKQHFKRFVYIAVAVILVIVAIVLLVHFLPRKQNHHGSSKNLTLALSQALVFFDAQKSGNYPNNSTVKFRGISGLQDGNETNIPGGLVGGFYDSGNNMKFTFPTAYTITLLSWTVIEYHDKYANISELDHVKDIIRWGCDYLLRLFVPPNTTSVPIRLYSQVGTARNDTTGDNDRCWQRPEDMNYLRPASACDGIASDIAGEMTAALSAASIVFSEDDHYSGRLVQAAEDIFEAATRNDVAQGTYTTIESCGGEARKHYNSSGYEDELVWGGTWLFFATGNKSYLEYATQNFNASKANEDASEEGIFYWNNKLTATAVLLTRLLYFHDPGYPSEDSLKDLQQMSEFILCSYVSHETFNRTPGGLILLRPNHGQLLQYAATASFLSKLYGDYLAVQNRFGVSTDIGTFSLETFRRFSRSQVNYILGDNPMKMSYMVGFGNQYPAHVYHRAASIPWNGQHYSCQDGETWLHAKDQNPNVLHGAMVAGPDQHDNFFDDREKYWFTEPSIASNAGLVAALVALHDPPHKSSGSNNLGIDKDGMFKNIQYVPRNP